MADLDVYDRSALDVGDGGYVRRSAAIPTQDANIDLAAAIAAGVCFLDLKRTALERLASAFISFTDSW